MGAGKGYRYPHDFPAGRVAQQYAPDVIDGKTYYEPTDREPEAAERSAAIERVLRAKDGDKTRRVGFADTCCLRGTCCGRPPSWQARRS